MSYFFGVNSDSVSTLFGSLGGNNSGYNYLGDYASIKNGSYGKLVKAHYKNLESDKTNTDKTNTDNKVNKNDNNSIANSNTVNANTINANTKVDNSKAKTAAVDMKDTAAKLKSATEKLTGDIFTKKDITLSDGSKKTDFDKDAIYKAVKNFADAYNDTLDAAKNVSGSATANAVDDMKKLTSTLKNVLSNVGISVSDKGKLSVSEEDLKAADVSKLKSVFDTKGSYGYQIGADAANLVNAGEAKLSNLTKGSYMETGAYTTGIYGNGSMFSDYI